MATHCALEALLSLIIRGMTAVHLSQRDSCAPPLPPTALPFSITYVHCRGENGRSMITASQLIEDEW